MIAFGSAVVDDREFETYAFEGVRRVAEPDSLLFVRRGAESIQEAYNDILENAGTIANLEGLVLIHQDADMTDPSLPGRLRVVFADRAVAVVGVVGGIGVRDMPFWEADECVGRIAHPFIPIEPGDAVPLEGTRAVDSVDGVFLALSPWAVRNLRFDPRFAPLDGYDSDICAQARSAGRHVLVIGDSGVRHFAGLDFFDSDRWIAAAVEWQRKWARRLPPSVLSGSGAR